MLEESKLFGPVVQISCSVIPKQTIIACVEAWRSHATLARQAASKFNIIIKSIDDYLNGLGSNEIEVPYQTNIWLAKLK